MYPILLLLCCLFKTLYSKELIQQPLIINPPPINVTINANTDVNQTSSTTSKRSDTWSLIPEAMRTSLTDVSFETLHTDCIHFFDKNRFKIVGISTCSTYAAAYVRLLYARDYLTQTSRWSRWRNELSTQTLLYMPEHTLAQELTFEVQQRYMNGENPTDFLSPLVTFLKEINEEIDTLHLCKKIYEWFNWLYITRIMLLDLSCFEQLDEQLQRARYLRYIFQRWVAEQNINSHCVDAPVGAPSL